VELILSQELIKPALLVAFLRAQQWWVKVRESAKRAARNKNCAWKPKRSFEMRYIAARS
jgi:hypothetical protein